MKTITLKVKISNKEELRFFESQLQSIINDRANDLLDKDDDDDYSDEVFNHKTFIDLLTQLENQK